MQEVKVNGLDNLIIGYEKHDNGLGRITYDLLLDGNDHSFSVDIRDDVETEIKKIDPNFTLDRVRNIEFKDGALIDAASFNHIDKITFNGFNTGYFGSNIRHINHILNMAEPQRIDFKNMDFANWGNNLCCHNARNYFKEVTVDGIHIPGDLFDVDIYPSESSSLNDRINTYLKLKEHGIPTDSFYYKSFLNKAPHLDTVLQNYETYGLMSVPIGNDDNVLDVSEVIDKDKRDELAQQFHEKWKRGVPRRIDLFEYFIEQHTTEKSIDTLREQFVNNFDHRRFKAVLDSKIPVVPALVLMTTLNKDDFDRGMKSGSYDILADICSEYLKTGEQRYLDLAGYVLKHPHINRDTALEICQNKKHLYISQNASKDDMRSELIRSSAFSEVAMIEDQYPEFKFSDVKVDLKFTDVELNGLKASIMRPGDTRMTTLGYDTNCCQKLGDAGETAMMYGLVRDKAGFFIIEDDKHNILAQAETWEKDDKTLVFDNIEFARDRDPSMFSEIIGKWAEKSPYENIVMGNGYNDLTTDKIRIGAGIFPPMDDKVKNVVGSHIYTDASHGVSIIKDGGEVEPYFKESHDERLFSKQERAVSDTRSTYKTIDQILESYKVHCNEEDVVLNLLKYGYKDCFNPDGSVDEEKLGDLFDEMIDDYSYKVSDLTLLGTAFSHDSDISQICIDYYYDKLSEEYFEDFDEKFAYNALLTLYMEEYGTNIPRELLSAFRDAARYSNFSTVPGSSALDKMHSIMEETFHTTDFDSVLKQSSTIEISEDNLMDIFGELDDADITNICDLRDPYLDARGSVEEYLENLITDESIDTANVWGYVESHIDEVMDNVESCRDDFREEARDYFRHDLSDELYDELNGRRGGFNKEYPVLNAYCQIAHTDKIPYGLYAHIRTSEDTPEANALGTYYDYAEGRFRGLTSHKIHISIPDNTFAETGHTTLNADIITHDGLKISVPCELSIGDAVDKTIISGLVNIPTDSIIDELSEQYPGMTEEDKADIRADIETSIWEKLDIIDEHGLYRREIEEEKLQEQTVKPVEVDTPLEPMTYEIPKDILTEAINNNVDISSISDGINNYLKDNFPENLYEVTIMPAEIKLNTDCDLTGQEVDAYNEKLKQDIPDILDRIIEQQKSIDTRMHKDRKEDIER